MLGASSCGDPQLRAADCSHPRLVRRLCASLLAADGQGSQDGSANGTGLQRALEDTAHAVLLGFEVGNWAGDDPAAVHAAAHAAAAAVPLPCGAGLRCPAHSPPSANGHREMCRTCRQMSGRHRRQLAWPMQRSSCAPRATQGLPPIWRPGWSS